VKVYLPTFEEAVACNTIVPNIYFDYLMPKLPPNAWKVLCVFIRNLYGWHKDKDSISRSQIMKMSGYSKSQAGAILDWLRYYHIIVKLSKGGGRKNSSVWKINTGKWFTISEGNLSSIEVPK
jgi:hypothetical protein